MIFSQMIRRLVVVSFAVALSAEASVVDQVNNPPANRYAGMNFNIANGEMGAQTFTAGLTGKLDSVDLFISLIGGSATVDVDVRQLTNGLPSNNQSDVLGKSILQASLIPSRDLPDWTKFDFSAQGLVLQKGAQYAIVLSRGAFDNNSVAWFGAEQTYADGIYYHHNPNSTFSYWYDLDSRGYDLGFRTNMATPVAAVPVPATAWLLGSGLLGLMGVARCKINGKRGRSEVPFSPL
jgi:hypothetical protein